MSERIQSVFGQLASKMQVMIDSSFDLWKPTWFTKHFDFGVPTIGLDFTTVIGRSRIEAAASVVDRESPAPLRTRALIEQLTGKVPAIKEAFKMSETDYRNMLTIQNIPNLDDATKQRMLLDLMFGDLQKASNAPMKKLDIMCLQAMSTGKIKINAATNPDGLILPDVDLLMPAANLKKVVEKWSVSATADPVTDIYNTVKAARAKGITYEKILMRIEVFWRMVQCTKFAANISAFYNPGSGATVAITFDKVNEYLRANKLPYIEEVNEVIGVEKDGSISAIQPWEENNITFVPAGKFGVIHNAFAMEELQPVKMVDYAKAGRVLVSKWMSNNPWGEFTSCELNAFPGVSVIDQIAIMQTETKI